MDHVCCDICWSLRFPEKGDPKRSDDREEARPCCFCHANTKSGIKVNYEPVSEIRCKGDHELKPPAETEMEGGQEAPGDAPANGQ